MASGQTHTHSLTHLCITSEQKGGTESDNITKQDNKAQLQSSLETIPHFNESPVSPASGKCDCICETITLSQSKEAAFKWSVKALSGANNHSSLSRCVTEVLNPPFVVHITCPSIDCLVLHFRHLDGHAFKEGPGPRGYVSCEQITDNYRFRVTLFLSESRVGALLLF